MQIVQRYGIGRMVTPEGTGWFVVEAGAPVAEQGSRMAARVLAGPWSTEEAAGQVADRINAEIGHAPITYLGEEMPPIGGHIMAEVGGRDGEDGPSYFLVGVGYPDQDEDGAETFREFGLVRRETAPASAQMWRVYVNGYPAPWEFATREEAEAFVARPEWRGAKISPP